MSLPKRHELDIIVRHVGELPDPVVPAYTAVDARLGWKADRNLELSLTLQNIFDPSHAEFGDAVATPPALPRSELGRSAYAKGPMAFLTSMERITDDRSARYRASTASSGSPSAKFALLALCTLLCRREPCGR